jgi:bacillithiol synthase
MDCRTLPFRNLPHQPKIFLQFLDNFPSVAQFYPHRPSLSEAQQIVSSIDYPADRRAAVAEVLREQNAAFGAGSAAFRNLDRFGKGAVAVVSGQQVGLFSGPAFAIYKALAAVQIAQELTQQGTDAVPVFWMATEDHDLDEVRVSHWFHGGRLKHFELPGNGEAGQPVGNIALGPQVREMAEEAAGILTAAGDDGLAQILRQTYTPEETYGSAFGKLFARLFAEQGLILLDPLDARLHRMGAPILRAAVEQRDVLNDALLARAAELEKAGFDAQVKVRARSTLLFKMCGGKREPIAASNGRFASGQASARGNGIAAAAAEKDGGQGNGLAGEATGSQANEPGTAHAAATAPGAVSWSREELAEKVAAEAECFSPNALLRPVLQDYLLPTAAYIAGPAEIAYFAQAEVLYRRLLGRMPVILPRPAYTIVDAKVEKRLKRYGLSVEDAWRGSQELRRAMEAASVPQELGATFDKTLNEHARQLGELREQVVQLDATLGGAVETARKKIAFQLEKLKRKAGKAEARKASLIEAHQEFLESWLYPHKMLQERELCFLSILASWGAEALSELQGLAGSATLHEHKVVRIP